MKNTIDILYLHAENEKDIEILYLHAENEN